MTEERNDVNPVDSSRAAPKKSSHKGWLGRVTDFFDSTTKVLLAIGGLIAAATALWAGLANIISSGSAASRNQQAATPLVVQPESCGALSYGADGNAGPVTCPDGRPNILAVRYFSPMHFKVLSLGADAGPGDVEYAICQDMTEGHSTLPIEASVVKLATAEQNWHFGIDPAQELSNMVAE